KVNNDEIERIIVAEVFKRDVIEDEAFKIAQKQLKKIVKKAQPKRKTVNNEEIGDRDTNPNEVL
ncbi:MAG TPA: hypothetical protein DHU63_12085, partial [Candidatus Marinimicrobia bacterium]|nr:hypothetical protein [Candidatus Neomarinimicrobiota bacterium]